MADSSVQKALKARMTEELGTASAEALVARLDEVQAGAATVLMLLDELEQISAKSASAAIEALPELDRRAGLSQVKPWLDLGVALAESSGATALKYFKDSPRILGLMDAPEARISVLAVGLEIADQDANVAWEYLKTAPEILASVPFEQLRPWLEMGVELVTRDVVVGLEYIRQIPTLAPLLPVGEVRTWLEFGMSLVSSNHLGKPDYIAVMEFLRRSPAMLRDVDPAARSKVLSLGRQLSVHSPESGVIWLAEASGLLRLLPSSDWQTRVLQYGLLLSEQDAEATLSYLRRSPELVELIGTPPRDVSRFEEWFTAGMEVLGYSREAGRAYFAMESRKALTSVEQALSGVPLRLVAK
jgi:hypothetical protein